jgi:hypothetical protein
MRLEQTARAAAQTGILFPYRQQVKRPKSLSQQLKAHIHINVVSLIFIYTEADITEMSQVSHLTKAFFLARIFDQEIFLLLLQYLE